MQEYRDVLLDFDGVILDSEERIMKRRNENSELSWDEFFDTLDWKGLYEESQEINDSLRILRIYQKMNPNLYIISKTHTLEEGRWKIKRLRQEDITIPFLLVPPHIKKSEIYIPNSKTLLVDDSIKNIRDWNSKGGYGVLFDPEDKSEEKEKVKSLEFLLRR